MAGFALNVLRLWDKHFGVRTPNVLGSNSQEGVLYDIGLIYVWTKPSLVNVTTKATGRIFVGARFKHAFELQKDKKKDFLLTKKYFYLVTVKSLYM